MFVVSPPNSAQQHTFLYFHHITKTKGGAAASGRGDARQNPLKVYEDA